LAVEQSQLGSGVQRLKTRPQFQAALAGGTVSRTPHFALHRLNLPETSVNPASSSADGAAHALFQPKAVWLGAMVHSTKFACHVLPMWCDCVRVLTALNLSAPRPPFSSKPSV